MKPAPYDLSITRGFDFNLLFYVRARDTSGIKSSVDLTGYTLESKLVARDGTTTTITATAVDAANGLVRLTISRTVTAVLGTGLKWYFALIDPSSDKELYIDGDVLVRDPGARTR